MRGITRFAVCGAVLTLALAACGGGGDGGAPSNPLESGGGGTAGTLTVGSANFPESALLGEIYAQALEAKGLTVTRKFNIGAREVYYNQVVNGGISVMPEYNGALLTVAVDRNSEATTTEAINAELRAKLPAAVEILDSAQAEDKDSVTVNQETARRYGLRSIADLRDVAQDLTIGAPSEFETRRHGLPGLREVYGVEFGRFQPFDAGAQSTLVELLRENEIQAADLFTTDPTIATNGFVVLEDPENLFAAQNVTPLVFKQAMTEQARAALNEVSARLTTQDLLQMMTRIIVDKGDQETVARDWLTQAGLVAA